MALIQKNLQLEKLRFGLVSRMDLRQIQSDLAKGGLLIDVRSPEEYSEGHVKDALLIPMRAVVELMYKKFVYIVGSDNKVTMKEVTLGPSVGRFYMVEGGLTGDETIVVEGTGKIRQGAQVNPQPMTEADLDTTVDNSATAGKKQ